MWMFASDLYLLEMLSKKITCRPALATFLYFIVKTYKQTNGHNVPVSIYFIISEYVIPIADEKQQELSD